MKSIFHFLFISVCILHLSLSLQAQTQYIDYEPDISTMSGREDKLTYLDIDFDGQTDLIFEYDYDGYSGGSSELLKIQYGENVDSSCEDLHIEKCQEGDTIGLNTNWSDQNCTILYEYYTNYHLDVKKKEQIINTNKEWPYSNWDNIDTGFMAIRKYNNGHYYYGWIKIIRSPESYYTQFFICELALNQSPDQPILAGELPSGANRIHATDIANNSNASDIEVSFYPAFDAENYSEYRVFVAKDNDTSIFNVEYLSSLSSNFYFSIPVEATDSVHQPISQILSSSFMDLDGDSIRNLLSYRVQILNIHQSANPLNNVLSIPSNVLYLEFTNLKVADVNILKDIASINLEDVQVSFVEGQLDNKVQEYRVYILQDKDTFQIDVNDLVHLDEDYFTKVLPHDSSYYLVNINPEQFCVNGTSIHNNYYYRCIVVSIADSIQSITHLKSEESDVFILDDSKHFFVGQKSGTKVHWHLCDSTFSNSLTMTYTTDTWGHIYNPFDITNDGIVDFISYGYSSHDWIENKRILKIKGNYDDRKVMLCAASSNQKWTAILEEGNAIGEQYLYASEYSILEDYLFQVNGDYGLVYDNGCLEWNINDFYIALQLIDDEKVSYAWLKIGLDEYRSQYLFKEYAIYDPLFNQNEELTIQKIKIYPNPTDAYINVEVLNNDVSNDYSIHIYNTLGVRAYSIEKLSQNQIDIHELKSGMYFLQILKNNKVLETHKLLKN